MLLLLNRVDVQAFIIGSLCPRMALDHRGRDHCSSASTSHVHIAITGTWSEGNAAEGKYLP